MGFSGRTEKKAWWRPAGVPPEDLRLGASGAQSPCEGSHEDSSFSSISFTTNQCSLPCGITLIPVLQG